MKKVSVILAIIVIALCFLLLSEKAKNQEMENSINAQQATIKYLESFANDLSAQLDKKG